MMEQQHLPPNQQERFKQLITDRIGLFFSPPRHSALVRGVLSGAAQSCCQDMESYYRLLHQSRTDSEIWDALVSDLTVGETYFFRNPGHFNMLRRKIFPELIARHRSDRRLRIWSAGCSTGEEPYSIAILLHQIMPDLADWNIFILATDINKAVLAKARKGRYRQRSFRQTDPVVCNPYFEHHGEFFDLKPEIRDMVTFSYLNLVEPCYPSLATCTNAMDLILCRNVMIYLPKATAREMSTRFYNCLIPEGWLIIGESEARADVFAQFQTRIFPDSSAYQKTALPRQAEPFIPTEPRVAANLKVLPPAPVLPEIVQRFEEPAKKPDEPLTDFEKGIRLLEQGWYDEAIQCFSGRVEKDPDFAPACYQLGRAHANLGRLQEARLWFEKALEKDPLMAEAHFTLAMVCREAGNPEEAQQQFKKALYLEPGFALAHIGLAQLLQDAGRIKDAQRHKFHAVRLVKKLSLDERVPGSDGLSAARLLSMIHAMK